ncbi:fatty acid desaturase [Sulfitobacter aquimarinus]|uniref:fatty acid desaturase n=1 Tax=Sulfitobacter aquimarinus TaxID=3158557 RepID=UPI003F719426
MPRASGYKPSPDVWAKKQSLRTPSLFVNMGFLLADYLCIWLLPLVIFWIDHPIKVPLAILCFLVSARGMRGLECLVHDGSHYNIVNVKPTGKLHIALSKVGLGRQTRVISDIAVNIVAAYPVFSTVQNYRASHELHHNKLGTEYDPDFVRHRELQLEGLDRSEPLKFFYEIANRLIPYWMSWWRAIGTDKRTAAIASCWHVLLVFSVSLAVGFQTALTYWIVSFLVPFLLVLPILRFIGEAAEHDYVTDSSVAEQTFSNTGWLHRLWLHPHNDGYHTLHHLFADVPHHNLRDLNRFIQENDSANYGEFLRNRVSVLQDV